MFVSEVIEQTVSASFFDMDSEDITKHHVKLPLPKFLKLFTNNNVSVPKAMAIAGKMFVVIPVLKPSILS